MPSKSAHRMGMFSQQEGKCFWCTKPLVLILRPTPGDFATRADLALRDRTIDGWVLSCRACHGRSPPMKPPAATQSLIDTVTTAIRLPMIRWLLGKDEE